MNNIILTPSLQSDVNKIALVKNQLIYCTDTLSATFDVTSTTRVFLGNTRQVSSELVRTSMTEKDKKIIYIVISSNKAYKVNSMGVWEEIINYEQIVPLLYATENMKATVAKKNGISSAVRGLAKFTYLEDGSTVQDAIEDMYNKGLKYAMTTKALHVEVQYDHQRIFDIPYPESNLNLSTCATVIHHNMTYQPTDTYVLGAEQLIFNEGFDSKKGDIITFIYHYVSVQTSEGVSADAIDNTPIKIGLNKPDKPTDQLIWIDTDRGIIWQYYDGSWHAIIDNNNTTVKRQKRTIVLDQPTAKIEIGIEGFDKDKDQLTVMGDSVFLDEGLDYNISADSKYITCANGNLFELEHDNYFTFLVLKNVPKYEKEDTPGEGDGPGMDEDNDVKTVTNTEWKALVDSTEENKNLIIQNSATMNDMASKMSTMMDLIQQIANKPSDPGEDCPNVTIMVDGGNSDFIKIMNFASIYGTKLCFSVIPNNVDTTNKYLTLAQLNQLQDIGHDIFCYGNYLGQNNPSTLVASDMKWMTDHGFNKNKVITYFNSTSDSPSTVVGDNANYIFTNNKGYVQKGFDKKSIPRVFINEGYNIDTTDCKAMLNNVVDNNGWLFIYITSATFDTNRVRIKEVLDYLLAKGANINTFSNILSKYKEV